MKLTITINSENAVFVDDPAAEVSAIMRKYTPRIIDDVQLASRAMPRWHTEGVLLDTNGNWCGNWKVRS